MVNPAHYRIFNYLNPGKGSKKSPEKNDELLEKGEGAAFALEINRLGFIFQGMNRFRFTFEHLRKAHKHGLAFFPGQFTNKTIEAGCTLLCTHELILGYLAGLVKFRIFCLF